MTNKDKLLQELEDLKWALQNKLVSVNEYCTFYYNISQQLKLINN